MSKETPTFDNYKPEDFRGNSRADLRKQLAQMYNGRDRNNWHDDRTRERTYKFHEENLKTIQKDHAKQVKRLTAQLEASNQDFATVAEAVGIVYGIDLETLVTAANRVIQKEADVDGDFALAIATSDFSAFEGDTVSDEKEGGNDDQK